MCVPGIPGKPTAAQLGGFNGSGGSGVTITGYTPDYGSTYGSAVQQYFPSQNTALNLFPDRGGAYTLSDGTTKNAAGVIAQNQQNAYGQTIPTPNVGRGQTANSFVGKELTAAPQPVTQTPVSAPTQAPVAAAPARNPAVNDYVKTQAQPSGPTPEELAAQAEAEQQAELAARLAREQEYSSGRAGILNDTRSAVNNAFSDFDDGYFDTFKRDYASYYTPQLDKQYSSAKDVLALDFARAGGATNNAAQKRIRELDDAYAAEQEAIRARAAEATTGFRGDINTARSNILGDVESGAGAVKLPEGVNDVGTQLSNIRSSLSGFGDRAKTAAAGITRPGFEDLGPVFGGFTAGSNTSGNIGTTSGRDYNTSSLYSARRAPVQKVVT